VPLVGPQWMNIIRERIEAIVVITLIIGDNSKKSHYRKY
jgi:hypothetical protein